MSKLRDRVAASRPLLDRECLAPEALLKVEAESLSQMATVPWPRTLGLWRHRVIEAARDAQNKGGVNAHFSFEAQDPRGPRDSAPHLIELGVQIALGTGPLVSYFFAIGQREQNSLRGLRKIHIDLEWTRGGREPKPSLHFQIGGRLPPALATAGYGSAAFDHLRPALDKPRIPCLPPSLALIAHIALLEYHSTDESLARFVRSSPWLRVITEAEQHVLLPYFTFGHSWLASPQTRSSSLLSGFYGLVSR